jgi:RNA polymerase-binding transcription factor DksA
MGAGPSDSVKSALTQAYADRADLRTELAALADPEVVAIDDEHDSEGATIGFERARVAGLLAQTERRIVDLEVATERVHAGIYQCCEGCGGQIGTERLEALPATRLCVKCSQGFTS